MEKKLKNKIAVVTGAGSGIGREIAFALGNEGAKVFLLGRTFSKLKETCELMIEKGMDAEIYVCDLRSSIDVHATFTSIIIKSGTVDVLVNNAADFGPTKLLEDTTEDEWENAIQTNVHGPRRCMSAVLPTMKKQKSGFIVNISSFTTMENFAYKLRTPYVSTKKALEEMSKVVAAECVEFGICVNVVSPSWTEGDALNSVIAKRADVDGISIEEELQKFINQYKSPYGIPTAEAVAERVMDCITSSYALNTTGQNHVINCGFRM